jgi:chlorophyll(ide) b reductase
MYFYIIIFIITILLLIKLKKKKNINSLKDKKHLGIVITGGSKGIGFSLAKEFLKRGHQVVICSRDENNLKNAINEVNSTSLFSKTCDVSNSKSVIEFVNFSKEKLKTIDIWVK